MDEYVGEWDEERVGMQNGRGEKHQRAESQTGVGQQDE